MAKRTKPDPELIDDDNPEWTEKDFAKARPAREVMSQENLTALRRMRGPQKEPTKELISIRLSRDVLEGFRASGEGWQTRVDEVLRASLKRRRA